MMFVKKSKSTVCSINPRCVQEGHRDNSTPPQGACKQPNSSVRDVDRQVLPERARKSTSKTHERKRVKQQNKRKGVSKTLSVNILVGVILACSVLQCHSAKNRENIQALTKVATTKFGKRFQHLFHTWLLKEEHATYPVEEGQALVNRLVRYKNSDRYACGPELAKLLESCRMQRFKKLPPLEQAKKRLKKLKAAASFLQEFAWIVSHAGGRYLDEGKEHLLETRARFCLHLIEVIYDTWCAHSQLLESVPLACAANTIFMLGAGSVLKEKIKSRLHKRIAENTFFWKLLFQTYMTTVTKKPSVVKAFRCSKYVPVEFLQGQHRTLMEGLADGFGVRSEDAGPLFFASSNTRKAVKKIREREIGRALTLTLRRVNA